MQGTRALVATPPIGGGGDWIKGGVLHRLSESPRRGCQCCEAAVLEVV